MQTVSIEQALSYAANLAGAPRAIGTAELSDIDGVPVVNVPLETGHVLTVWIEDGRIYGEW